MINNILKKAHYIFFICLLHFSLQGQGLSIQAVIDNNCLVQISLIDSSNQIVSNQAPYFFSVAGLNYNSNSVASARLDLSNQTNGTHVITIIDGQQNSYSSSLINNCGTVSSSIPILSTSSNSSDCNQCDAVANFQITNPDLLVHTFTWDDGFVHFGTTSAQRSNICPGVYNIWVQDTLANNYSLTVNIACNGSNTPQNASCYSDLTLDLSTNNPILTAQNLSSNPITNNTEAYLIGPDGIISSSYTLSCYDLGYNNFTLLFIDSVLQTADTCNVLLKITDSLGICNGYHHLNYEFQDSLIPATTCSTCDGIYIFSSLINLTNSTIIPSPYTYLWSDGSTQGASRTDLCPNKNYILYISDNNGITYSKTLRLGCNNPSPGSCIDSNLIINNLICTSAYAPVCGCDAVTYQNSCIAERIHGLASWTAGACDLNELTLNISTNPASCDTSLFCDGVALVNVLGGISPYTYVWSDSNLTSNNINNLCPGTYSVTVIDANGKKGFSFVIIGYESCVWPGDADDNTVANNFDLLPIALNYGNLGPTRNNATNNWTAQPAQNWLPSSIQNLANPKHFDSDGNGVIDSSDLHVVLSNYGQSYHRSTNTSLSGSIPFYVESAAAALGDTLLLDIILGEQNNQAINAYALAFTLNYDTTIVKANTVFANFNNSWLGNDLLEIQKDFSHAGQIEIAIGRKDKTPITGFGTLGSIVFTIKDDVIIGKVNLSDSTIITTISISSIRLIDQLNNEIGTNPQTGLVELNKRLNIKKINPNLTFNLFPNPTKGLLNIQSKQAAILSINLYNAMGQLVYYQKNHQEKIGNYQQIQTGNLPSGIYFISIQTDKGIYNNKVQIIK